ncbi:MAG: metallophosphoesterase family protein [Pseudomonadota bacterium]
MMFSLPPGHRVYAIGDVHGMAHTLTELLAMIDAHMAAHPPEGPVVELFLGDYVDRGPDSYGVIQMLLGEPNGRQRVCLLGNHEDAMLSALCDVDALHRWLSFGGEATCRSYGVDAVELLHDPLALQTRLQAALPPAHRSFLSALPRQFALGEVLFVHAGVRPDVALDAQDPHDLIWIRDPFLHHDGPLPMHIVHGHTPAERPERTRYRTNVDTAAVYGGALTAAVLEGSEATFLSVPTV